MKKLNSLSLLFALLSSINLFGQEIIKSPKYGYSMELPEGYSIAQAIGENIDLKAANMVGNSIIVLVKKMPTELKGITINDMLAISNEQWESSLNEYLPNPNVVKKGKTLVDGKDAYYIHYTTQKSTEPKLYQIDYGIFVNGFQYILTFTCDDDATDHNMPYFMKSLRSFRFKKQ